MSNVITMGEAIALCQEIYPNLTWEVTTEYSAYSHGKIYGTMARCHQFIDLTLLIGGNVAISLVMGNPNGYNGQAILLRESGSLGKVDPGYDLGHLLKGFQRRLIVQARLNLIFTAYQEIPHTVNEDFTVLMWQHEIDKPEEGMT